MTMLAPGALLRGIKLTHILQLTAPRCHRFSTDSAVKYYVKLGVPADETPKAWTIGLQPQVVLHVCRSA